MEIYIPKEDSFFLAEILKKYLEKQDKQIKICDMGTGSGIISETAFQSNVDKKNILAVDLNEEAVKFVRKKSFHARESNLFKNVKEKFDLVVFNPPYLPEDRYDKEIDTSGGKQGDETILKFLKQVKKHLTENGQILLLLSSLTPRKKIEAELKKQNLKKKIIKKKKIFFETLEVWLLQP